MLKPSISPPKEAWHFAVCFAASVLYGSELLGATDIAPLPAWIEWLAFGYCTAASVFIGFRLLVRLGYIAKKGGEIAA